jgi:hypothetical protein
MHSIYNFQIVNAEQAKVAYSVKQSVLYYAHSVGTLNESIPRRCVVVHVHQTPRVYIQENNLFVVHCGNFRIHTVEIYHIRYGTLQLPLKCS